MGPEPTDIRLSHAARRRNAAQMHRGAIGHHYASSSAPAPATAEVIDEAFAGLSHVDTRLRRVDAGPGGNHSTDLAAGRAKSLAVVSQLSAQLDALDRHREQLAQLLRDIEHGSRAGQVS